MKPLIATLSCLLVLSGCATNGISVAETTPDGGTLIVKQRTMSSWGSKTEEGAGDFVYTGTAQDGSNFDMRAGAGVIGQQAGDPAAMIASVVNAIAPLVGQSIQASQSRPPERDDRAAELAEIRAMLEALIKAKK